MNQENLLAARDTYAPSPVTGEVTDLSQWIPNPQLLALAVARSRFREQMVSRDYASVEGAAIPGYADCEAVHDSLETRLRVARDRFLTLAGAPVTVMENSNQKRYRAWRWGEVPQADGPSAPLVLQMKVAVRTQSPYYQPEILAYPLYRGGNVALKGTSTGWGFDRRDVVTIPVPASAIHPTEFQTLEKGVTTVLAAEGRKAALEPYSAEYCRVESPSEQPAPESITQPVFNSSSTAYRSLCEPSDPTARMLDIFTACLSPSGLDRLTELLTESTTESTYGELQQYGIMPRYRWLLQKLPEIREAAAVRVNTHLGMHFEARMRDVLAAREQEIAAFERLITTLQTGTVALDEQNAPEYSY
jgi:hypothetical protein